MRSGPLVAEGASEPEAREPGSGQAATRAEGANEPQTPAAPLPAEVTREAVVQEAEAAAEPPATAEGGTSPEPAESAPTDEEHQP